MWLFQHAAVVALDDDPKTRAESAHAALEIALQELSARRDTQTVAANAPMPRFG